MSPISWKAAFSMVLFLIARSLCATGCPGGDDCPLRVAIVGSGIAGSSAAYFMRQEMGKADIVVFEAESRTGGRVSHLDVFGHRVEVGGSVYHESNEYMASFVQQFGAKSYQPFADGRFGLWAGQKAQGGGFVVEQGSYDVLDKAKFLWRYGMSPITVHRLANEIKQRWCQIYALQRNGTFFKTPQDMAIALGTYHLTQKSLRDELVRDRGVSPLYVDELVTAIMRVNYGQSTDLNALTGYVSLVGGDGNVYSVEGGNDGIITSLLGAANADVRLSSPIEKISRSSTIKTHGKSTYTVHYRTGEGEGKVEQDEFDVILLATPLEHPMARNIQFDGFHVPQTLHTPKRRFQVTHATFVVGHRNPSYFHRNTTDELPETILTTENAHIPFSSFSQLKRIPGKAPLYKIFSREPLTEELLDALFTSREYTHRKRWEAYPVLDPAYTWPPFIVDQERQLHSHTREKSRQENEEEHHNGSGGSEGIHHGGIEGYVHHAGAEDIHHGGIEGYVHHAGVDALIEDVHHSGVDVLIEDVHHAGVGAVGIEDVHHSGSSVGFGGIYYINAFESAVSCMETEIAAAKNAVLLAVHRAKAMSG